MVDVFSGSLPLLPRAAIGTGSEGTEFGGGDVGSSREGKRLVYSAGKELDIDRSSP